MTRIARKRHVENGTAATTRPARRGAPARSPVATTGNATTATAGSAGATPGANTQRDVAPGSELLEALASSRIGPPQADDVSAASVAAIAKALREGRIVFDADRLATLIERFHGGRR